MRKGMTLMEIVVGVVLLGAVSVVALALFNALVGDIPRAKRALDTHAELCRMLRRMRQDVDAATALPAGAAVGDAAKAPLSVSQADGVVSYEMRPGRVVRSKRGPGGKPISREALVWDVPHALVRWGVWQGGGGSAVEVHTAVEVATGEHTQKKLTNAHLFFLGATAAVGETR